VPHFHFSPAHRIYDRPRALLHFGLYVLHANLVALSVGSKTEQRRSSEAAVPSSPMPQTASRTRRLTSLAPIDTQVKRPSEAPRITQRV
jgi:hypothetical protein